VTLTARALNRATLARQLLLAREALTVPEAVGRVVAVQAQTPASPYLALWNRVSGFSATDLDAAYAAYRVVKASLMRITLHVVRAEDYPTFHHAMVPLLRAARLNDDRFKSTGLTTADADASVPDVLARLAQPRTNAEMEAWLEERYGRPVPRLWWALRHYAPVVHAPTGHPWTHGERAAYTSAPSLPPTGDPAESVQRLVWRYLEGFGPATAADVAQFTFLRRPSVTAALAALDDYLDHLAGPDGATYYDVPGGVRPDGATASPPRLLGMWDNTLLAYADRGRVLPEAHRRVVIRRNGDVLPVLLVDGSVAGVWRPAERGIEVTAFGTLPARTWKAVAAEAEALAAFLADRDTRVYSRYRHWWDDLAGGDVRVVG
jgi:winged helix DNA-binding protein